jgi:glycosyltransferase involved in cell wall biosynthesis
MFCGEDGIPIVTDSQWLLNQLRQSMPGVTSSACIYYGLDESLFKPLDKGLVRKMLGLPLDSFIILGGAVNLTDYRKGGHIFQKLSSLLKFQRDVCFLVFGAKSDSLPGAYSTGLLRDYRKMPLIYNAADIFVNTSLEEAFGQTMCEASACEVPIVAFPVGGVPEIARHGINARLVSEQNERSLADEVNFFRSNREERLNYGKSGRLIVEREFTLLAQGQRWMDYLESL